jgi:multisubunit Na+/H+ antiporter MnhG subunit
MTSIDVLGLTFAFLALFGAGIFFWRQRTIAGLAFLVAFIIALASVSQQHVVFSSALIGLSVEKGGRVSNIEQK